MPSLSDNSKRLIVQRLATFTSHSRIVEELKEQGVTVSFPQIAYYDPESRSDLAQKWKDLHAETRKLFIEDTARIAISHRSFRLAELDRLYRTTTAGARVNVILARDLLVEAEKITGEFYTNKRVLSGPGNEPLIPLGAIHVTLVAPTPDNPVEAPAAPPIPE